MRTILRRSAETAQEPTGGATLHPSSRPSRPSARPRTPFALDHERMQIRYYGRLLELSRYEYGLLRLLVQRPGRVFTRDDLLRAGLGRRQRQLRPHRWTRT